MTMLYLEEEFDFEKIYQEESQAASIFTVRFVKHNCDQFEVQQLVNEGYEGINVDLASRIPKSGVLLVSLIGEENVKRLLEYHGEIGIPILGDHAYIKDKHSPIILDCPVNMSEHIIRESIFKKCEEEGIKSFSNIHFWKNNNQNIGFVNITNYDEIQLFASWNSLMIENQLIKIKTTVEENKSAFFGYFRGTIDPKVLIRAFNKIGIRNCSRISIPRDENNRNKGFAFLVFNSTEDREDAIASFQSKPFIWGGRILELTRPQQKKKQ